MLSPNLKNIFEMHLVSSVCVLTWHLEYLCTSNKDVIRTLFSERN